MTDERFDLEKYLRLLEAAGESETLSPEAGTTDASEWDDAPHPSLFGRLARWVLQRADVLIQRRRHRALPIADEASVPPRGAVKAANAAFGTATGAAVHNGTAAAGTTDAAAWDDAPQPTLFERLARWALQQADVLIQRRQPRARHSSAASESRRRAASSRRAIHSPEHAVLIGAHGRASAGGTPERGYGDERADGAESIQPRQRRARRRSGASESREASSSRASLSREAASFREEQATAVRSRAIHSPEHAKSFLSPAAPYDRTNAADGDNSAVSAAAAPPPNGAGVSPHPAAPVEAPLDRVAKHPAPSYADDTRIVDAAPPLDASREWETAAPSVADIQPRQRRARHSSAASESRRSSAEASSRRAIHSPEDVIASAPTLQHITRALDRELRRYG